MSDPAEQPRSSAYQSPQCAEGEASYKTNRPAEGGDRCHCSKCHSHSDSASFFTRSADSERAQRQGSRSTRPDNPAMQEAEDPPFNDLDYESPSEYPSLGLEEEPLNGRFLPQEPPAIGAGIRYLPPSRPISGDLDRTMKAQRELEELREKLWAERLLLREKRQELRRQREKASAAEARLVSSIRRFCLQAEPPKPEELVSQFGEVQAERDALGTLDVEYDEAEDQYDALEWSFDHGKSEEISKPKPQIPLEEHFRMPIVDQYLSHVGEAEMLQEELNDIRMEQAELSERDREFFNELNQICASKLEQLHQVQRESERLRQQVIIPVPPLERPKVDAQSRSQSEVDLRRTRRTGFLESTLGHEDWALISVDEAVPSGADVVGPCSETAVAAVANLSRNWSSRISRWILTMFDSPLVRAQHKAILGRPDLDRETWRSLVKQSLTRNTRSGKESKSVADSVGPSSIQRIQQESYPTSAVAATTSSVINRPAGKALSTGALDLPRHNNTAGNARTA